MLDRLFKFYTEAGALFQNFLQFKSGGEQISDMKANVQPVMEMRDFIYPPTSTSGSVASTTTTKFPMHGGFGIYRLRGMVMATGTTVTAGQAYFTITAKSVTGTAIASILVYSRHVPATTNFYDIFPIDILFDVRDTGGQAVPTYFEKSLNAPDANTTDETYAVQLVAQRVV